MRLQQKYIFPFGYRKLSYFYAMKQIICLLFSSLLLLSCNSEPELSFSTEYFSEEDLEMCKTEVCSAVTLEYVKAEGDSEISEKINQRIETYIIKALFLGDDENPNAKSIPEAVTDFIMAYRDYQPDVPSELDFGGYDADVRVSKSYENEDWVSLRMTHYLFTGGAHGYGSTTFTNIDVSTGLELPLEDLFTDIENFTALVESKFRAEFEIPANGSINATGFWFKNDQFYLPEAIGFEGEYCLITYNRYEIASYAAGPINLEIPISEITSFLENNPL